MSLKRLFIVTGDVSGDIHGAEVIHQLKKHLPQVELQAIGGHGIAATGVPLFYEQQKMGAFGASIFGAAPSHFILGQRIVKHFETWRPDAVLLIDYGIFNLWLAKLLKKRGIKVFYYIPPQVWASRPWRLNTIERYVDHVFCIFPFEKKVYEDRNIPVTYVGHPLTEQLSHHHPHRETFCTAHGLDPAQPIFGLFPGSRKSEVKNLLPPMLEALPLIQAKSSTPLQFVIAQSTAIDNAIFEEILNRYPALQNTVNLKCITHANRDILALSQAALVASGTVTLEAALYKTPIVITYKMPWIGYLLFQKLCLVKSIGLPNLLAKQPFLPELLQNKVCAEELSKAVMPYLTNTPQRKEALANYDDIETQLGSGSASFELVKSLAYEFNEPFFHTPEHSSARADAKPENLDLSGV